MFLSHACVLYKKYQDSKFVHDTSFQYLIVFWCMEINKLIRTIYLFHVCGKILMLAKNIQEA